LYGLQAIAAHNGWAMALAGALIVFSGLVILSFVISQLHKILMFRPDSYYPKHFLKILMKLLGFINRWLKHWVKLFIFPSFMRCQEKMIFHIHILHLQLYANLKY